MIYPMMNLLIDSLFELRYAFMKKPQPSLLAIAVERFTNSSWLEDLYHFKSLDEYLDQGKGAYVNASPIDDSHCEQVLEMMAPN